MKATDILRDGAGLIGLALLGYGCWLIHPPAAFVVVGALLLAGAVLGTIRGGANVERVDADAAGEADEAS